MIVAGRTLERFHWRRQDGRIGYRALQLKDGTYIISDAFMSPGKWSSQPLATGAPVRLVRPGLWDAAKNQGARPCTVWL